MALPSGWGLGKQDLMAGSCCCPGGVLGGLLNESLRKHARCPPQPVLNPADL